MCPDYVKLPTAKEVFAALPSSRLERSTLTGVILFAVATITWVLWMAGATLPQPLWIRFACSIGVGVWIAVLFVVGHDACHGSLTPRSWLNKLIGRLSLVHSLHPFTSWKYSHNALHHGWTCVQGKDIVFVPFSKKGFTRLPRWRRCGERFFRSILGLGPFYWFTVWIPYEMFPNRDRRPRGRDSTAFQLDRVLVWVYCATLVALLVWAAFATQRSLWQMLAFGIVLPQLVFVYLMGYVSYLHHTHPRSPWYASADEYEYFACQVRSTVHAELPLVIEWILHRILSHTAHHADPRVPLYHLAQAQKKLEHTYPEDVIVEPWSVSAFLRTLRTCRLYDYDRHRWLDWDGTPLTPSLLAPGRGRGDASCQQSEDWRATPMGARS